MPNVFENRTQTEVPKGENLIKQGDEGDYFYVVITGKVGLLSRTNEVKFALDRIWRFTFSRVFLNPKLCVMFGGGPTLHKTGMWYAYSLSCWILVKSRR